MERTRNILIIPGPIKVHLGKTPPKAKKGRLQQACMKAPFRQGLGQSQMWYPPAQEGTRMLEVIAGHSGQLECSEHPGELRDNVKHICSIGLECHGTTGGALRLSKNTGIWQLFLTLMFRHSPLNLGTGCFDSHRCTVCLAKPTNAPMEGLGRMDLGCRFIRRQPCP